MPVPRKIFCSSRVSTFLACLSSYNVIVYHIAEVANPSSDFSSRNPQQCVDSSCEICKFVHDTAQSVVNTVSISDILSGSIQIPFTNRNAWKSAQRNCQDLRCACSSDSGNETILQGSSFTTSLQVTLM